VSLPECNQKARNKRHEAVNDGQERTSARMDRLGDSPHKLSTKLKKEALRGRYKLNKRGGRGRPKRRSARSQRKGSITEVGMKKTKRVDESILKI